MKSEKREKENDNRKMKTPVYDGEGGKSSSSWPIWESTLGVSMLLEKAALRRFILPDTTGCVMGTVLDWLCSEAARSSALRRNLLLFMDTRFYCWRGCLSKKALLIRLATQRECCVTSKSMRCLVFSGLRLRQRFFRKILQNAAILQKIAIF